MARVLIEFEDGPLTKDGGWIRILNFKIDPPLLKETCGDYEGKVDPKRTTLAQFLANDIGLLMQRQMTHAAYDGDKS